MNDLLEPISFENSDRLQRMFTIFFNNIHEIKILYMKYLTFFSKIIFKMKDLQVFKYDKEGRGGITVFRTVENILKLIFVTGAIKLGINFGYFFNR